MGDLYDDELLESLYEDELDNPFEDLEPEEREEEPIQPTIITRDEEIIEILPEDDEDEASEEAIRMLFPEKKKEQVVFNKPEEEEDISDEVPSYRKEEEDDDEDISLKEELRAFLVDVTPIGLVKKGIIVTLVFTYIMWISLQKLASIVSGADTPKNPFTLTYNMITNFPLLAFVGLITALILTLLIGIIYVGLVRKKKIGVKKSENATYGDGQRATEEDLKGAVKFTNKDRPTDICLGLSEDEKKSLSLAIERGNKNVLVAGSSGSGKDYTFVNTGILVTIDKEDSGIVLDPAGDTYNLTSTLAKKKGYNVKVLNMKKLDASDGWDMLQPIKKVKGTYNETTEINSFVDTFAVNATHEKEIGSYYDKIERNLLACLVSYVALDDNFYGQEYERHIGTVYDILVALMSNGGKFPLFDMLPNDSPAKTGWKIFSGASQGQKEAAMTGLEGKLNVFRSEMLKEIFSHNEIDLSLPGREKCLYYIITDVTRPTYQFVLSLFFSSLIQTLIDQADELGKANVKNVNIFLNEFKASGVLTGFADKLANVRKYNINLIPIVQDIEQLEKAYPGEMNTIMSNCDTLVVLGVNDNKSAKIICDAMGEMTIVNESTRMRRPRFNPIFIPLEEQITQADGKRFILTTGEIRRLRKDNEILVLTNGRYPYVGHPYPYTNHYLAKYVDKKENQSNVRNHLPMWQNEEKNIEKYRTFLDPDVVDVSRVELEKKIRKEKGLPEEAGEKSQKKPQKPQKKIQNVLTRYDDSRTLSSDIFDE